MHGVPAIYLGRIVEKEGFRTFIFAPDGSQKLVESWDEYERHMESGLWFAQKEDAVKRVPVEKPKRVRKAVDSKVLVEEEEPLIEEELIPSEPEVVDDFLPKVSK